MLFFLKNKARQTANKGILSLNTCGVLVVNTKTIATKELSDMSSLSLSIKEKWV
jgi:hypothetical protein